MHVRWGYIWERKHTRYARAPGVFIGRFLLCFIPKVHAYYIFQTKNMEQEHAVVCKIARAVQDMELRGKTTQLPGDSLSPSVGDLDEVTLANSISIMGNRNT